MRIASRELPTDPRGIGTSGFDLPLFNLSSVPSWVDTNGQYGRVTFVTRSRT